MFEAVGYLLEWLASWIPRIGICRATHGGVKFNRGKITEEIKPGLFLYWPIVTEISLIPTARRTINLESQTLTTHDSYAVTVTMTVVYRITDVIKALVDTEDIEDTIGDVALRANIKTLTTRRFTNIRANLTTEVKKEITRSARTALRPFGVTVLECDLVDFMETTAYRIVGTGGPTVVKGEE